MGTPHSDCAESLVIGLESVILNYKNKISYMNMIFFWEIFTLIILCQGLVRILSKLPEAACPSAVSATFFFDVSIIKVSEVWEVVVLHRIMNF